MSEERQLISLKEAAQLSGYSADYIGQLIRSGKIQGKQVYTNIAWMTTAEDVLSYKNKGKDDIKKPGISEKIQRQKNIFSMQLGLLKLIFTQFKASLPLLVFIFVISIILALIIFSNITNKNQTNFELKPDTRKEEMKF